MHQARVTLWDYIEGFFSLRMPFFLTTLKIPEELPKRPSTSSHYLFLTYPLTLQQYLLSVTCNQNTIYIVTKTMYVSDQFRI